MESLESGSTTSALVWGTGVFLRAFFCDWADSANIPVTMISSTPDGDARVRLLNAAQGKYTLAVRGIEDDDTITDTVRTVRCISTAYTAADDWTKVLDTARLTSNRIVVCNVTESAFKLHENGEATGLENASTGSFPAKMTAWLHERWQYFNGDDTAGVILLPCELIAENGSLLRDMILHLADRWNLEADFCSWLAHCCTFADTLVDRIVAGTPPESEITYWRDRLGYNDPLLTICEPYTLWAIRGNSELADTLKPLIEVGDGNIVVTEDITPYSLRKVRILNGVHTAMASRATQYPGIETVLQVVNHAELGNFLREMMDEEIVPTVTPPLAENDARAYAEQTWARFSNPFLVHPLANIRRGEVAKWENRLAPTIRIYEERFGKPPERILRCRAAAFGAD